MKSLQKEQNSTNLLKVSKSWKQLMVSWILSKNERWISALEDYYFKVGTKRESMFFLQEDTLFCANFEVVNFQGRNPMFIFLANSGQHNLVSRLSDLYYESRYTIPGIVLCEIVLSGDPLYLNMHNHTFFPNFVR